MLLSFQAALVFLAATASASPDPRNWGKQWSVDYPTGEVWNGGGVANGAEIAKNHAYNACKTPGGFYHNTYFKSWASSPYTSKLCVNTWGSHVDFEIGNLNPSAGFTLNQDDCYRQLGMIIQNTQRGGETQVYGWYFRVDPNAGNC